jgi:hypothetical protein
MSFRKPGNRVSATSLSAKIQVSTSQRLPNGRTRQERQTLTATKIRLAKETEAHKQAGRRLGGWILLFFCLFFSPYISFHSFQPTGMNTSELLSIERLCDVPDSFDDGDSYEADVLHGRTAAEISHAGEALATEETENADAALLASLRENRKYVDLLVSGVC